MSVLKVMAPVFGVLLLLAGVVATADAEQESTGPILINVYTTDCSVVATIDGCYDVYLCQEHPDYNETIAGIEVVEDCLLVLQGVRMPEPEPVVNPSVPALVQDAIVISFTG